MAPERVTQENVLWVVGQQARAIENLDKRTEDLNVIRRELGDLVEDVKALRRALYTFAFSVTGGAILFAITVFQVVK